MSRVCQEVDSIDAVAFLSIFSFSRPPFFVLFASLSFGYYAFYLLAPAGLCLRVLQGQEPAQGTGEGWGNPCPGANGFQPLIEQI